MAQDDTDSIPTDNFPRPLPSSLFSNITMTGAKFKWTKYDENYESHETDLAYNSNHLPNKFRFIIRHFPAQTFSPTEDMKLHNIVANHSQRYLTWTSFLQCMIAILRIKNGNTERRSCRAVHVFIMHQQPDFHVTFLLTTSY